ncbi:MAG: PAS domain S-box protein [bacterium]
MNDKNNKTILLVEDEVIIGMTEKMELEKYGYSVHLVTTGEKAVQTILDNVLPVDLILMDIDLGAGIDGTQAAEQILEQKDIPIVFLSSHTEPEVVKKTEKITSYGYVVKNSGCTVLDASIKMALKLFDAYTSEKKKDLEIKEREETYRNIFQNAQVGLYRTRISDGKILECNRQLVEMFGYTNREEFIENYSSKNYVDAGARKKMFDMIKKKGSIQNFEARFYRKDRSIFWVKYSAGIFPEKGWIQGVAEDITERKQFECALRESEERFRKMISNSADAVFITDQKGNYLYVNQKATEMLGYSFEEFTKMNIAQISSKKRMDENLKLFQTLMETKKIFFETELEKKLGGTVPVDLNAVVMENGQVYGSCRDITERKLAKEEINRQLSEKETLLKEVHHRIKNNMATIESLLSLQIRSTENPDVKTALGEAKFRAQSIRVLYEKLLISKDYQDISVKNYTESLIDAIVAVFAMSDNVTIEKQITDFKLNTKKLIPLGFIINELFTNVVKYSFKGKDNGHILIILDKAENHVTLTIQDNGIGIDDINVMKSPGFGLTIVKMLTEQLKGTFTIENDNGTKSVLKFEI